MKAIKFSSRRSRLLSVAMFTLALASLLLVSCEKEKLVEVPVVTTVTDTIEIPATNPNHDTCDRPHEAEDLIAWYSPLIGVFLIDPVYLEDVLSTLQAQPTSDGGYVMEGVNLLGEPRIVPFKIELVNAPDIYLKASNEPPLTPDLIGTYEEKGTSYKVYKNAECGGTEKGFDSPCDNNTDGTSTKRTWFDTRHCKRGGGFCTEAKGIIGKSVTYHNANCQGPVKEESSYYGYTCWQ